MPETTTKEGLKRVIDVRALAASVVNFSIGSGVYVVPAIICIQLGAAGVLGYLMCALMFVTIILCYVELGTKIKKTGGSYAYVESAFGPYAGFIVNWLFFFGWGILADAAILNFVADTLAVMFPALKPIVAKAVLFFILLGIMAYVNIRDAEKSVRIVTLFTMLKLIPLIALILFGLSQIEISNLKIAHLPSLKTFGESALMLFFVFAGFESSLTVSGEIKDPVRTVPRGILLGGLTVLLFYVVLQTLVQGVLGDAIAQFKEAPFAAIAERAIGATGAIVILIAAAISGLSTLNGDVFSCPRLLFAGANDGLFPRFLGKVHPKYGTPHWAILVYATLIFLFAVSGGFKQLAVLASGALLIIYLSVVLSLIKLRLRKKATDDRSFKIPGGISIPLIAVICILYVLTNLTKQEALYLFGFIAIISLIYLFMKKLRTDTGISFQLKDQDCKA